MACSFFQESSPQINHDPLSQLRIFLVRKFVSICVPEIRRATKLYLFVTNNQISNKINYLILVCGQEIISVAVIEK